MTARNPIADRRRAAAEISSDSGAARQQSAFLADVAERRTARKAR